MPASVVLIGLDASDIGRIEQLIEAGRMPNLARLREAGQHGRLRGRLHHFDAMTWPRWTEGRNVTRHYSPKIWQPDSMTFALTGERWQARPPFWVAAARAGAKVAILDVPHATMHPNGAASYIKGWQIDLGARVSAPAGLWDEIGRRFGAPIMRAERYGVRSPAFYPKLRADLLAATEQAGGIGAWLLGREPWDLFVMVLGAPHRAGHYLWDRSQIDSRRLPAAVRRLLDTALDDIYAASDQALGRVLDAAPAGACCIAFSPFGMKPNTGWSHRLEQITAQLETGSEGARSSRTLLGRVREALPRGRLIAASNLLPPAVRSQLMRLLTSRLHDWSRTRYLALPGEPEGFIRINLAGRESRGIVAPGAELAALVAHLREALSTLRDLDTDLPVVDAIMPVSDLVAKDAAELRWLPDLVISWTDAISAQASRGLRFDGWGEVRWPKGAPHPSGRSGAHHGTGWYAAAGPGIRQGAANEVRDPIDIAPTIYRWLGLTPPEHLDGAAIESLLTDARAAIA